MPLYRKIPFLRILLPFITGIIGQYYFPASFTVIAFSLLLAVLFFFVLGRLPIQRQYRLEIGRGILFFVLWVGAGQMVLWQKDIRNRENWIGNAAVNGWFKARVTEPPVVKKRSYQLKASLLAFYPHGTARPLSGELYVYIARGDSPPQLPYGTVFLFRSHLQKIRNRDSTGRFDYAVYCARQQVYHWTYLQAGDYRNLKPAKDGFMGGIFRMRDRIIGIIRHYVPGGEAQGLAEALLIGYRGDLDKELVNAYNKTGIVHIIAISGMHLALIYGLLQWCLRPLWKFRGGKLLAHIGILLVLWAFALLAGAGPSVIRAAVMITLLLAGNLLERDANAVNQLAASAFLLLCWNPFWLWDAGFWLSYMAVLGIMLFYRPLRNVYHWENPLLRTVWEMNMVCLSAQVLTFPLVLYYFRQFPVWFLLTNLVAVPLSGWILYSEILLILTGFFPLAARPLGGFISWLIGTLNRFIRYMERMPLASVSVDIGLVQMFLLFLIIFLFYGSILYPRIYPRDK